MTTDIICWNRKENIFFAVSSGVKKNSRLQKNKMDKAYFNSAFHTWYSFRDLRGYRCCEYGSSYPSPLCSQKLFTHQKGKKHPPPLCRNCHKNLKDLRLCYRATIAEGLSRLLLVMERQNSRGRPNYHAWIRLWPWLCSPRVFLQAWHPKVKRHRQAIWVSALCLIQYTTI